MPPNHNYDEPTTPTLADEWRRYEQEYSDRPRRTCLGAGCCPWCGRPAERCECWDGELNQERPRK